MEIYPLQTFLSAPQPQQQASSNDQITNRSIQPINVDPSSVWLMPGSPENYTKADKLALYNKAGIKQVLYVKSVNPHDWQPDYYSVLEKGLDPEAYQQEIAKNQSVVPAGGEAMADEVKQIVSRAAQPESTATPIADSMNISLHAAEASSWPTWNLNSDNPNFLAEAVVAYDKAQTEIERTYSDQAIVQRATAAGITNIATYEQTQYQTRDAEKSAAEQKFENKTELGIGFYVTNLYQFFDPSQTNDGGVDFRTGQFSENPDYQQTQDNMANLTVELNKLYGQYKQTHAVDYSKDSVEKIAAQFNVAILNQAKTTLNISGTGFTYKDLYLSHAALQAIGSNDMFLNDPFSAALGQSGINYLAQNKMTPGAAAMLQKSYGASFDEAMTHLNNITYGKDQPAAPDKAFQMLEHLDTTSPATFSSSFNQAFSQLQDEYSLLSGGNHSNTAGINNSYDSQELDKLQNLYNTFQHLISEVG